MGIKLNKVLFMFIIIFSVALLYPSRVFAADVLATCTYASSQTSIYQVEIEENYDIDHANAMIQNFKGDTIGNKEKILNWTQERKTHGVSTVYSLKKQLKGADAASVCPASVVVVHDGTWRVYGFMTEGDAKTFANSVLDKKNVELDILSFSYSKNSSGETLAENANNKAILNKHTKTLEDYEVVTDNKCESILGDSVVELLQQIFNWIKVLGPILVLILSSIDFTRTVLVSDDDAMKKAEKKLGIRLLCAAGLYFLPWLVTMIINLIFGTSGDQICGIK